MLAFAFRSTMHLRFFFFTSLQFPAKPIFLLKLLAAEQRSAFTTFLQSSATLSGSSSKLIDKAIFAQHRQELLTGLSSNTHVL